MTTRVHPSAIVDPSAVLADDVEVGAYSIVGAGVELGEGCVVGPHVVLKGPTRLGPRNRIFQFATIGEDTPALAYGGEATVLEIGSDNVFREGVTVHRGMVQDEGRTVIGSHNLLMAYVHVGHDCVLGDHIIMANNASVAGHVHVGDRVNFGGYAQVAQFRTIGAHAMLTAMSLLTKDIPAFVTASGHPAGAVGMNTEGMRRRGFDKATIKALRDAYATVYRQGLTLAEAEAALADSAAANDQVRLFVDSLRAGRQGIVRPRGQ